MSQFIKNLIENIKVALRLAEREEPVDPDWYKDKDEVEEEIKEEPEKKQIKKKPEKKKKKEKKQRKALININIKAPRELPGSRRMKRIVAFVVMIFYAVFMFSTAMFLPMGVILFTVTIYLLIDYLAITRETTPWDEE